MEESPCIALKKMLRKESQLDTGHYMYHGLSQYSNNHQTNRSQFSND